jgi:hypothetical protein
MSRSKRGYLNISLPVHREDTIYTCSEALKNAQSNIMKLEHAVKERDAVIKERDAVVKEKEEVIQRLERELQQKEGVVQKLKAVGPGVKMGSERMERVKRADRMMELMGMMRERERERQGYDPL